MHQEQRKARVINVYTENFLYTWLKGLALKRKTSLRGLVNEILQREHERHQSKAGVALPSPVAEALTRVEFEDPEIDGAGGMRLSFKMKDADVETLTRFARRADLDIPGLFDFLFQLQKVEEIKLQFGLQK